MNHTNVIPDLLVFAKGIGSGMPISGVATRSELTAHQVGALPVLLIYSSSSITPRKSSRESAWYTNSDVQ